MKNHWLFGHPRISAGILAAAMVGCGKPKVGPVPPSVKIAVEGEAAPTINRDANGDPLSVVVRVYHLKDMGEFSRLTFDLATSGRSDQELLGTDLLGRSEFVVVPGTAFQQTAELAPGTKYVGLVAFFRKPDPNYWRYLVSRRQLEAARAAKKHRKGKKLPLLSFKVQDCYLTMNDCKPELIPGQPMNAKPECGGASVYAPVPAGAPATPLTTSPRPAKPQFPKMTPPGP